METDIRVFEKVDSTNITLGELADRGAPEGTCVIAFAQEKGQGRSGRSFYSPDGGNLYMSLLLRPKDAKQTEMITVIAAVAAVRAIKEVFSIDTGIKWVNDIVLDGRKVCGIVAQAHNFGTDDLYVILGIGINIYEATDIPEDIASVYGSLFAKKCDIPLDEAHLGAERLSQTVITEFSSYYENGAWSEAIDEYRKHCIVIGKKVLYMSGDRRQSAVAAGIDDDGGIILEEDGIMRTYRDGEIRIIPQDMHCCELHDESL